MADTRIDPGDFAWGDICDVYGNPYQVGDWFTLDSPIPMGGPKLLVHIEPPEGETEHADDAVEGRYYYVDPVEPDGAGGWSHYKLRELTIKHHSSRATPALVERYLRGVVEALDPPDQWVADALAWVEAHTQDGRWLADEDEQGD